MPVSYSGLPLLPENYLAVSESAFPGLQKGDNGHQREMAPQKAAMTHWEECVALGVENILAGVKFRAFVDWAPLSQSLNLPGCWFPQP